MEKILRKIYGGEVKLGEKIFFPSPSKGDQVRCFPISHQAWNLPKATKFGTFH
jgi:hypothetical protein